ncbi:glycosyltransferase family 2 protein [Brevibacterium samyangense]|uniref:glycosyltransferase family 2 protein n=1 Tax=Brevibacterium samyangense TaxID=366888 RepID=UPI0031E4685C
MSAPDLTVIIPAKNGAQYLGTLFRSLERQFRDGERAQIIFVNDGSTDHTERVLEDHAGVFDDFTVIRNERSVGLASGRNMGLREARGEYVVFLDGDDWLPDGQIRTVLDAARRLDVDFVRCDHTRVEGTKRELRRAPMAIRDRALPPRAGILPAYDSTMVDYPFAWAGIFHRRLLDNALLYFPEGFMTAEDRSWIWNLHLHAESFAVVDSPGVCYRRGVSGSLTQILDVRQLDFIRAFEGIFDLVAEDTFADLYWPKATRNWLAILEHQAKRFASSPADIRAKFASGARRASARVPFDVLREEFRRSRPDRQALVHRYLPQPGLLVKDIVK